MGKGRVSDICRDCGKPNDRPGLLCCACKIQAKRLNWRKADAFQRASRKRALEQAQSYEPEVVPAHKLHEWMGRNLV